MGRPARHPRQSAIRTIPERVRKLETGSAGLPASSAAVSTGNLSQTLASASGSAVGPAGPEPNPFAAVSAYGPKLVTLDGSGSLVFPSADDPATTDFWLLTVKHSITSGALLSGVFDCIAEWGNPTPESNVVRTPADAVGGVATVANFAVMTGSDGVVPFTSQLFDPSTAGLMDHDWLIVVRAVYVGTYVI